MAPPALRAMASADPYALHVAIVSRDDAAIGALLARGHSVNVADPAGATPLIVAAGQHPAAVARLLHARADASARLHLGNGAAHFAAIGGAADALELLGRHAPDALIEPNRSGDTPALMCCAAGGRPDALRALLRALRAADEAERGAAPERASGAQTPLARGKRPPPATRLSRAFTAANAHGDTPLLLASRTGAAACVCALLDAGADALARHQRMGASASELLRGACAAAAAAGASAPAAREMAEALGALEAQERAREALARAAADELLAGSSGGVTGTGRRAKARQPARAQPGTTCGADAPPPPIVAGAPAAAAGGVDEAGGGCSDGGGEDAGEWQQVGARARRTCRVDEQAAASSSGCITAAVHTREGALAAAPASDAACGRARARARPSVPPPLLARAPPAEPDDVGAAACATCAAAAARLRALSPRAAELALAPADVLATAAELRALSVTQLELLLALLSAQVARVGAELGGRSQSLGACVCAAADELSVELLSCGVGLAALDLAPEDVCDGARDEGSDDGPVPIVAYTRPTPS
ncbi:hypothetical protein KFE25_001726 [Diacronema lutheri]|uniref:ANK_REP_REGION domain-containing protein n=1 Tax=Diacronema lutheri TaxID=2081491 RepID=A0A8J6CCX5_DIALT|nr:hypothetical protein KFE25_001726 [Diacronema lutheri]